MSGPTARPGLTMGFYNGWSPDQRLAVIPLQRAAMRDGLIPMPTCCTICGFDQNRDAQSGNRVWLHDEDYDQPLAAYPVCRICHRLLHERFDDPAPWSALVSRHGRAGAWFTFLSCDPACQWRPYRETYPAGLPIPSVREQADREHAPR